jgi:hypothetical protein
MTFRFFFLFTMHDADTRCRCKVQKKKIRDVTKLKKLNEKFLF